MYVSQFRYGNSIDTPVTVIYYSADYGSLSNKGGKFTIYDLSDTYEVRFGSVVNYPLPFSASQPDDYVVVSDGKRKFTQRFGDKGSLFDLNAYTLDYDEFPIKIYGYTFSESDFANAEPV